MGGSLEQAAILARRHAFIGSAALTSKDAGGDGIIGKY
jgi:hypothetical protein